MAARRCYYPTRVQPFLEDIKFWRENGDTEKMIADKLNIGITTLNDYKLKYPELLNALSYSKQKLIDNLKKTVYQIALDNKKKIYIRNPRTGKLELEKIEETYTRTQLDAAIIALHKLDPTGGWKETTASTILELEKALDNFKSFGEEVKDALEDDSS